MSSGFLPRPGELMGAQLRIAHFSTSALPAMVGGKEVVVHNLCREQAMAGHEVSVITRWKAWRRRASNSPYRVLPLLPKLRFRAGGAPEDRLSVAFAAFQIAAYQRKFRFDVWHVHSAYPAGLLAQSGLRRMDVPTVVTSHGDDVQTIPALGYGYRLIPGVETAIASVLRHAECVTAVSESVREEYLELGVLANRIQSVPNGADVRRIRNHPTNRQRIRDAQGWGQDECVILTIGRNHPKKGYSQIPRILREVLNRVNGRRVRWVLVGRGTDEIRKLAEAEGLGSYVQVVGELSARDAEGQLFPASAIIDLLKAADVFMLPSLKETFGLVLVEAMAAGLPVVTTNVPGCRDVIHHGYTGLLAEAGNCASIAENIILLMRDPLICERLVANGLAASEAYDWPRISDRYLEVYRRCATAGVRP